MGHDLPVELKHLKHFVAVAEEAGISAAARRLGLTQPTLSRQIQVLEQDLGVTLLDRGASSFALTPAAEILVTEGRKLLESCAAMTRRVQAAAAGLPLRIGYSPSLAADFLPHAIASFNQLHPGARISLLETSTLEMRRSLLAGTLDLIVTVPCPTADAIRWTTLRECGWRLVVSANHRLAAAGTVEPADLNGERLLLFDRDQYPDYWSRVTGYFKDHRIQAKVAGEFDGIASLTAAVEANLGIAMIAETSRLIHSADRRVLALSVVPAPAPIVIAAGVVARYSPPPHVLAFIGEMKIVAGATPTEDSAGPSGHDL
jgi:DNA-binding transcriptional LysR family regulator